MLSFSSSRRAAPQRYQVSFPNKQLLNFEYDIIQLNRLGWHDYLNRPNPVASALIAKMRIAPEDKPLVKAQCTAMLFGLQLDEEQRRFMTGFSVKTTANFSYDVTLVTDVEHELTLQKLQPGDTAAGKVVFEVPSSDTLKSITFDDFTNNVTVSLQ